MLDCFAVGARAVDESKRTFSLTPDEVWYHPVEVPAEFTEHPHTFVPPVGDFVLQMSCFFVLSLGLCVFEILCLLVWRTSC